MQSPHGSQMVFQRSLIMIRHNGWNTCTCRIRSRLCSGIPVTLTFIDSNGNLPQDTVTTDGASGAFSYVVPSNMIPVAWRYIVIASFDGTHAYASSSAQSSLLIGTAAGSNTNTYPTGPSTLVDTYFLPAVIAIIIILIVGIALIMLMLRRRP